LCHAPRATDEEGGAGAWSRLRVEGVTPEHLRAWLEAQWNRLSEGID